MSGNAHQTRRLHLITNLEQPDVFMGMTNATDPEPASVTYTPLAESIRRHPCNAEAPTAS